MHLRLYGFTYNARSPCKQKNDKKIKETGDSRYFHENELDKSCFQHEVDETTITERITKTIY